jgi:hypothetical protein
MQSVQDEDTLINSAVYTHDYEAEALAIYDTEDDVEDKYASIFEADLAQRNIEYTEDEDVGGVIIYRNNAKLVAFYDYERFVGAVF